jgi:hypothetical protein
MNSLLCEKDNYLVGQYGISNPLNKRIYPMTQRNSTLSNKSKVIKSQVKFEPGTITIE